MKLFKYLLIIGVVFSVLDLHSQVSAYKFKSNIGTYSALPTSSHSASFIPSYKQIPIPLGFNFRYAGIITDTIWVSVNGYLSFYNDYGGSYAPSYNLRYKICPLLTNLEPHSTGGSSYLTTGTTPNRVFTFQWKNYKWDRYATNAVISFQVKLYESSNKIEFVYRPEAGARRGSSATVGLSTTIDYLAVNKLDTSATAGASRWPSITHKPDSGLTFEFSPPTCIAPLVEDSFINENKAIISYKTNIKAGNGIEYKTSLTSKSTWISVGSNNSKIEIANLQAAKEYTLYTRFVCSAGDTSAWHLTKYSTSIPRPIKTSFVHFSKNNLSTVSKGFLEASNFNALALNYGDWDSPSISQLNHLEVTSSARLNMNNSIVANWIIIPTFTVDSNDYISLKAATSTANGIGNANLYPDHYLDIMITLNNGMDWKVFRRISSTDFLSNSFSTFSFSLKEFIGKPIRLAIRAKGKTPHRNYDLHVTDVYIGQHQIKKLQIIDIYKEDNTCQNKKDKFWVVIKNSGTTTIDFSLDSLKTELVVSGGIAVNDIKKYKGKRFMLPEDTFHVFLGKVDLYPRQFYFVSSKLHFGFETIENNLVSLFVNSQGTMAKPMNINFESLSASWIYQGWTKGLGVSGPVKVGSNWRECLPAQKTHFSISGGASIPTYGIVDDWMVTSPLLVESGDSLSFEAALASTYSLANDTMHTGDTIFVMITDDCGKSWNKLTQFTKKDSLRNSFRKYAYDLKAYKGKLIKIGFYAKSRSFNTYYSFFLNNMKFGTTPKRDVAVVSQTVNSNDCYKTPLSVEVVVRNAGSNSLNLLTDSIVVSTEINGNLKTVLSKTIKRNKTLSKGDTAHITVGYYKVPTGIDFEMRTHVLLDSDANIYNNWSSVNRFTGNASYAVGDTMKFKGYNGSNLSKIKEGWKETLENSNGSDYSNWTEISSKLKSFLKVNNGAMLSFYGARTDQILTYPFMVKTGDSLKFQYAVTAVYDTIIGSLDNDDSLHIMIQICGGDWQELRSFSAKDSIKNRLKWGEISLSSYSGSLVRISFKAKTTASSIPTADFILTKIVIGKKSRVDLASKGLNINSGCNAKNDFGVIIKNEASSTIHFNVDSALVSAEVLGVNVQKVSVEVKKDSLLAGDSTLISLANLNLGVGKSYSIKTSVLQKLDNATANNFWPIQVVESPEFASKPYFTDFSDFQGYPTSVGIDGWKMARGKSAPVGRSSNWTISTKSQLKHFGKTGSIKINVFDTLARDWIISPRFRIENGDVLKFKIALTKYGISFYETMGLEDSLKILVSEDCGSSWKLLGQISQLNQPYTGLNQLNYSLNKYSGKTIQIAFLVISHRINKDYDLHLTDFYLGTTSLVNLAMDPFVIPRACYGSSEDLYAVIRNAGTDSIDLSLPGLRLGYKTSGTLVLDSFKQFRVNKILQPGDTFKTFLAKLNLGKKGEYKIMTYLKLPNDSDQTNDSSYAATIFLDKTYGTPQKVDFRHSINQSIASAYPGWKVEFEAGHSDTIRDRWIPAINKMNEDFFAEILLHNRVVRSHLKSPKVSIAAGDSLLFKLGQENVVNLTNDSLKVIISTDCDSTWQTLKLFTNQDTFPTNRLKDFKISLNQFAGKNVRISFFAVGNYKGLNYRVKYLLTDIFIGNPTYRDIAIDSVYKIEKPCHDVKEKVYAVLKNSSSVPINLSTLNLRLGVETTTPIINKVSSVSKVNKVLPAGDTMHILAGTINTNESGIYDVKVTATLDGDVYSRDDTSFIYPIDIERVYKNPQYCDFKGYAASGISNNLRQVFPGWTESQRFWKGSRESDGKWQSDQDLSRTFGNSWSNPYNLKTAAKVSIYWSGWVRSSIITPRMSINPGDSIKFISGFSNYTGGLGTFMTQTNEEIALYVSENCGETWKLFQTLYNANNSGGVGTLSHYWKLSLDRYKGKDIKIALIVNASGNNKIDFYITNIYVGSEIKKDIEMESIVPFNSNCGSNKTVVQAKICNNSRFSSGPFQAGLKINGSLQDSSLIIVNNIPANSCRIIDLDTINTNQGEKISFTAFAKISGDQVPENDSAHMNLVTFIKTPRKPTVTDDSICRGAVANLKASGGNNFKWYKSQFASQAFALGNAISVRVFSNRIFYATNKFNFTSLLGVPNPSIGNGAFSKPDSGKLIFNANNSFSLDSVTFFADTAGVVLISVTNNSNTIFSRSYSVTGNKNGEQVYIGVTIPRDTNYVLKYSNLSGSSVRLRYNSSGINFPYSDSLGVVEIVKSDKPGTYFGFYNIRVSGETCESDRVPAKVTLKRSIDLGPDLSFCKDSTVSILLDATSNGANYKWDNGSTAPTVMASKRGAYVVTVTWPGVCQDIDTVILQDFQPIPVSFTNPPAHCETDSTVSLSASPIGGLFTGNFVSGSNFDILKSGAGVFSLFYTVNDSHGCSYADTSVVEVRSIPTFSLGNDTAICPSISLTLDPKISNMKYDWNTGSSAQKITVNSIGDYSVKIWYPSLPQCSFEDTISVSKTVCLGSEEIGQRNGISIYPNPSSAIVNIKIPKETVSQVTLRLYSLSGQLIMTKHEVISTTEIQMDATMVAPGEYILRVETEKGFTNFPMTVL